MPQKKNPDMAELTRGKTGRLYGNLVSLMVTLKALPSAYNRDLQEDKEAVFDSVDTIAAALAVWTAMLPGVTFHREKMAAAASDPALYATDLAEYLVKKDLPFREAHETVGRLVAESSAAGKALNKIPLEEMRKISPLFEKDVFELFDARQAIAKRSAAGGPALERLKERLSWWQEHLKSGTG